MGRDAYGFAAFETLRTLGILRKTTISQPDVRDTVILDSIFFPSEMGMYVRTGKKYFLPDRYKDTLIYTKTDKIVETRDAMNSLRYKNRKK